MGQIKNIKLHIVTDIKGYPGKWLNMVVCACCATSVRFEQQVASQGKVYHRNCLRCVHCKQPITPSKHLGTPNALYCLQCHNNIFSITTTKIIQSNAVKETAT